MNEIVMYGIGYIILGATVADWSVDSALSDIEKDPGFFVVMMVKIFMALAWPYMLFLVLRSFFRRN